MVRAYITLFLLLGAASVASSQDRYAIQPPQQHWVAVGPKPELPPLFEPDSKLRLFGVSLVVGVPEGITLGVSFHPWTNLLHLDLGVSGALSLGFRGGVTLDPFDWVVSPTLTVSAGYNGWADLPFDTSGQSIRFETAYLSVQPGIELGRRSRFRVFIRGGYSHLWVNTDFWPSFSGNQATSPTKLQINLWPSLNLGLTAYF